MGRRGHFLATAMAAMAVSPAARASDAIILAEPEAAEYVRVCDTYGTGFLYIPGTETCLRIGGYVRHQINYNNRDVFDANGVRIRSYTFSSLSRAAPSFDIRSETELGTLRGFNQTFFNANSLTGFSIVLEHTFVELQTRNGTLLFGKTDTPFRSFLGRWAGPTMSEGTFGGSNTQQITYTFDTGSGFGGAVAAVNPRADEYMPNMEAGLRYVDEGNWVAAVAAYGHAFDEFSARLGAGFDVPGSALSFGAQVMYADRNGGMYALSDEAGSPVEWSALFTGRVQLGATVTLNGHLQWFDSDEWSGAVNLAWAPVRGMRVIPELAYDTATKTAGAVLRFQRDF